MTQYAFFFDQSRVYRLPGLYRGLQELAPAACLQGR